MGPRPGPVVRGAVVRGAAVLGALALAGAAVPAGAEPLYRPDLAGGPGGFRAVLHAGTATVAGAAGTLAIRAAGATGAVVGRPFDLPATHDGGGGRKSLAFVEVRYCLARALAAGRVDPRIRVLSDPPHVIRLRHFEARTGGGPGCVRHPRVALNTRHPLRRAAAGDGRASFALGLDDATGSVRLSAVSIEPVQPLAGRFAVERWDAFEAAAGAYRLGINGSPEQPGYAPPGYVSPLVMDTALKLLRTAGFSLYRTALWWGEPGDPRLGDQLRHVAEREPESGAAGAGAYARSLAAFRAVVERAASYGFEVQVLMRGSPDRVHPAHRQVDPHRDPETAMRNHGRANGLPDPYPGPPVMRGPRWLYPPDDWSAYREYVRAVVGSLRGRVRLYEIFNEINVSEQDAPVGGYRAYALWVRHFARAARAVDPEVRVIAAASDKMLAALVAEGMMRDVDGVAFHLYSGSLSTTRAIVASSGRMVPLYMSEYSALHPGLAGRVREQVLWGTFNVNAWPRARAARLIELAGPGGTVDLPSPPGTGDRIRVLPALIAAARRAGRLPPGPVDGSRAGDRVAVRVEAPPRLARGGSATVVLRARNRSPEPLHEVRLWPVGFVEALGGGAAGAPAAEVRIGRMEPGERREIAVRVAPRAGAAGRYPIGLAVVDAEGRHSLGLAPVEIVDAPAPGSPHQ